MNPADAAIYWRFSLVLEKCQIISLLQLRRSLLGCEQKFRLPSELLSRGTNVIKIFEHITVASFNRTSAQCETLWLCVIACASKNILRDTSREFNELREMRYRFFEKRPRIMHFECVISRASRHNMKREQEKFYKISVYSMKSAEIPRTFSKNVKVRRSFSKISTKDALFRLSRIALSRTHFFSVPQHYLKRGMRALKAWVRKFEDRVESLPENFSKLPKATFHILSFTLNFEYRTIPPASKDHGLA